MKDRTGGEDGLPNDVAVIPTRYTCRKSRTTYFTPSNFTEETMTASASPPACKISRSFVYGLRLGELYSGQALYCLHGGGQGSREKDAGHVIVYGASSLGVIHDLVTNTQKFFDKHDDELTCITVDPSCNYVLSGQLGAYRVSWLGWYIFVVGITSFAHHIITINRQVSSTVPLGRTHRRICERDRQRLLFSSSVCCYFQPRHCLRVCCWL